MFEPLAAMPTLGSDFPWMRAALAALAGVWLGRYLWNVAYCYDDLLNDGGACVVATDRATHTTAVAAPAVAADTPPDAHLLGRALHCGLRRAFSRIPAGGAWLAHLPATILAVAYALLTVHADNLASALALAWAVALLLLLALIDARTSLLPDALTLPLLWTGLVAALMGAGLVAPADALAAVMIAYAALWLLAWFFLRLRGRDGMGGGDVKLLAAIGAWIGWPDVFLVLLCASVTGLCYALVAARGRDLGGQHPFGPHLAGAALVLLVLRVMGLTG